MDELAEVRQTLVEISKVQLAQARILVEIEEKHRQLAMAQKETDKAVRELAVSTDQAIKELSVSQQITEHKLQSLIDTLREGATATESLFTRRQGSGRSR